MTVGKPGFRFIDAETIARLVTPFDLLEPIRRAFSAPAQIPARTRYNIETGGRPASLLIMPAWSDAGTLGVKLATVVPDNPGRGLATINAIYLYFSAVTGQLEAVLDGEILTLTRTAAVSALAADMLASTAASRLVMVGAGALAPYLIRAYASIRKLDHISVWARDAGKAGALAETLRLEGLPADAVTDLRAAVETADIISCATLSTKPLVLGAWLKDGAHLDLVGAFRPDMREADASAIIDGGLVVDTMAALQDAGELIGPLRSGFIIHDAIPDLAALVMGKRPKPGRITVFKSVGTALSDLASAQEILRRFDSFNPPDHNS